MRPSLPRRPAPRFLLSGAASFVTIWLGLHFTTLNGGASLVWPTAGLCVALLLLMGRAAAPALLAGALAGALVADLPFGAALGMAVITTVTWSLVALSLKSFWRIDARMARLTDVGALVVGGALAGSALSATLGVTVMAVATDLDRGQWLRAWLNWWGGDLQGVLYVAPLVLAWAAEPRIDPATRRNLARLAAWSLALSGVVAASIFYSSNNTLRFFSWFPLFGLAIWVALSYGLRELVTVNAMVAAMAVGRTALGAVEGYGPSSGSPLFLHGFLTLLALTTLAIAANGIERRRAMDEVRASEQRFRRLAELSSDWVWELDAHFRFSYLSPGLAMTVADAGRWIGRRLEEIPGLEVEGGRSAQLRGLLERREPFRNELFVLAREGGEPLYFEVSGEPFDDPAGGFAGYRGVGRDVTQRKRDASRIEALAMRDALTGLPNRTVLEDRLAHALANAERHQSRIAVMFIDLDGFKQVNDSHGHATGDLLLRGVAQRIASALRRGDTLARIGGDEFVVVLEDVSAAADIERVASKILAQLETPLQVGDVAYVAGASIGVAIHPDHGADQAQLLRNADAAMYRAKAAGRNRYELYAATAGGAGLRPSQNSAEPMPASSASVVKPAR